MQDRLFPLLTRWSKQIVLIFLLAVFSLGLKLPDLKTLLNTDDLIPESYQTYPALRDLRENFRKKDYAFLLVENPEAARESWDTSLLCRLRDWSNRQFRSNSEIVDGLAPFYLRSPSISPQRILYPRLVNLDCDSRLPSLSRTVIPDSPWQNLLYSPGQKDLNIDFFLDGADISGEAGSLMKSSQTTFGEGIKLHWYGTAPYQYFLKYGYRLTGLLNLFVSMMIIVGFRVFYGTYRSSFIFLATLGTASLLLYETMAVLGYPVDILTNCIFMMLTLSTIEDYVYLSSIQVEKPGRHWFEYFREMAIPCGLTTLTTVLGFVSLNVSDLAIIRRFGNLVALGSVIEWVLIFTVLPSTILAFKPKKPTWVDVRKIRRIPGLESLIRYRLSFRIAAILLLIIPAGVLSARGLYVDENANELFLENNPYTLSLSYLHKIRNHDMTFDLIFSSEVDPAAKVSIFRRILRENDVVTQIDDYGSKLRYFTRGLTPTYSSKVETDLKSTMIYDFYHAFDGRERDAVYVSDSNVNKLNTLRASIDSICGGKCFLSGSMVAYAELGSKVPKTLIESFNLSILLVGFSIYLIARHKKSRKTWAYVLSAIWGPAAVLLFLAVLKVKIYFATSVFASILIGFAGDNAIQYLFSDSKRGDWIERIESKSQASMIFGLFLILLPVAFMLSYFRPIRSLGYIFGVGAVLFTFGDFWLLKGLIGRPHCTNRKRFAAPQV